tara:strand:- start:80 stop:328 length:249 start_codon:yes stop_codon:yes gene_type:complete
MIKLKYTDIMPLAMSLYRHLQNSISDAASRKIENIDPELFAKEINERIKEWNPKINKKTIFDEKTRLHCAHLIAGITLNVLR